MSDFTIRLKDLEVEMYLGLHAFEKERPQRVLISARIDVTGIEGNEESYFDYDAVADYVRGFADKHVPTQEELIRDIHAMIVASPLVKRAEVRSKKPDVYPDCAYVGVAFSG